MTVINFHCIAYYKNHQMSFYDEKDALSGTFCVPLYKFLKNETQNMEQALYAACNNASEGEVVLLSPACASWDQFPNYEVRGKLFKNIVSRLKREN